VHLIILSLFPLWNEVKCLPNLHRCIIYRIYDDGAQIKYITKSCVYITKQNTIEDEYLESIYIINIKKKKSF